MPPSNRCPDVVQAFGIAFDPDDADKIYVGTDCGICMACCPFSHVNNRFHNFVRWMVKRLPWFHRPLKWMDDLFYGRNWKGLEKSRT